MTDTNYDNLVDQIGNELHALRRTLDVDVDSMSKKELKRSVRNLKALLIATLEHPLDKTQEIPEYLSNTLEKCIGVRFLQTAITMHAVSDKELGGEERELIREAKQAESQGDSDE